MREKGIESIVDITRRSNHFKKLLEKFAEIYSNRIGLKEMKKNLQRKDKKFAERVYAELEKNEKESLEIPCKYFGKSYEDIKSDPVLIADIVLKYCIVKSGDLEQKLIEKFQKKGVNKSFLERKYTLKKNLKDDRKILDSIGRDPYFLVFMRYLKNNRK
ncbi:MAG: hypothetical protein ABIH65_00020 [Nanoarchaeota archaeon]